MKNKTPEIIDSSFEVISTKSSSIGSAINEAGRTIFKSGKAISHNTTEILTTSANLVGDLNGDGKVDIEDAKIAISKAKQVASSVVDESSKLGKEVMQSELVKDVAPYAAIGAAIAVPIPIIGPAIGAAIGATLGLYKNATKKK